MIEFPMTDTPCPRCMKLALEELIRAETVQPLPLGAFAPVGQNGQKCCFDCQAADNLMRRCTSVPDFTAARIAVGNDRQEQYRLPGAPMGLVRRGIMQPSKPGDLAKHIKWLDSHNWFGQARATEKVAGE